MAKLTYWLMPYPRNAEHLREMQDEIKRNDNPPKKDSKEAYERGWYMDPDGTIYSQS